MAPGWKVTIDDQPAEALTVDYLFRGVFVPPGSHRVRWTYDCPGFRMGIGISLATLGMLVFLAVAAHRFFRPIH